MLDVYYHKKFDAEKQYVFDVLLNDILGLEYSVHFHDKDEYKICFNGKEIVINDSFFSNLNDKEIYYKNSKYIPLEIIEAKSDLTTEDSLIGIYGNSVVTIGEQTSYIGVDIIASAFFMLTRWEEIAIPDKDKHGRFIEQNLFSIKYDFHKRPVVNEYVEFLWNILQEMGYIGNRKNKEFEFYPTHDVDFFEKYDSFFKCCKVLSGDLIKRRSISTFFTSLKGIYNIKIRKDKDVFDTFDYFMDISESKSVKSRFYFMPGSKGEKDVTFDIKGDKVKEKIRYILNRGHVVGIHPTYNSFDNLEKLNEELGKLQNIYPVIEEGRQHFLRFSNPTTWQMWNDCGLKLDSTVGFYDNIGFRAGICNEYHVFNVITRKQLNLKERPLLMMDTALRRKVENKKEFIAEAIELINIVKQYNGDFVMLWHNSNLLVNEWKDWNKVYSKIVESI